MASKEKSASVVDDEKARNEFVNAKDPFTLDRYLQEGTISSVNVVDSYGWTSLFVGSENERTDNVIYGLTSVPPAIINQRNCMRGYSALVMAAFRGRHGIMKTLINFGAARSIVPNGHSSHLHCTALDIAKKMDEQECVKLLEEYFPSKREELEAQLNCKLQIDELFKSQGHFPRFNQDAIDMKYQTISAVISGDIDLLKHSLAHVDKSTTISLIVVAIESDHLHLLDCLFESILDESFTSVESKPWSESSRLPLNLRPAVGTTVFDTWIGNSHDDKSIEPLFLLGLDVNRYSKAAKKRPSLEVARSVNKSLVVCLLNLLFHKLIYLDMGYFIELLGALKLEGLYCR